MKVLLLIAVASSGCVASDQFSHAIVSQAVAHVDPAKPDARAQVSVTLSLIGGDRDHDAVLESVALGDVGALGDVALDLTFPTPTVALQAKTTISQPLVAGDIRNRTFAGACETTLPIIATLSFEDTANLISDGPPGEIAVFCSAAPPP